MCARRTRRPSPPPGGDAAELPLFSGRPATATDRPYVAPAAPELPGMPPHVTVNGFAVPTAHAGAVRLGDRRPYIIHHAARHPLPPAITADYTRADPAFGGLAALAWLTADNVRELSRAPGVWLVRLALAHETLPAHWKES